MTKSDGHSGVVNAAIVITNPIRKNKSISKANTTLYVHGDLVVLSIVVFTKSSYK